MIKLAIFDMDGTLYNTNDVNYFAYKEALDEYNVKIDYDYYCRYCNGRHFTVFIPPLVDYDKEKTERIHSVKKTCYSKHLSKAKVNEHLFEIINLLKDSDCKIALVTTASKENTYQILDYTGTREVFDLILTAEDVTRAKPEPDGFLKAIAHFNASIDETLIFEDSDVGVVAAKATGASVIRIETF